MQEKDELKGVLSQAARGAVAYKQRDRDTFVNAVLMLCLWKAADEGTHAGYRAYGEMLYHRLREEPHDEQAGFKGMLEALKHYEQWARKIIARAVQFIEQEGIAV